MHESTFDQSTSTDLIVIGGGLAGLTAAALAARAKRSVRLVEKSSQLGGRATTTIRDGIFFNLGPHALYRAGDAFRVLRGLGVPFEGGVPDQGTPHLLLDGTFHVWPQRLRTLVRSPLFPWREKWKLIRFLRTLGRLDAESLNGRTVSEWVRDVAGTGNVARLLKTLLRLSTFVNDEDYQSAGAALAQLQLGQRGNVWYLHRGWQTLVDGLKSVAEGQGAELVRKAHAVRVTPADDRVQVTLQDGTTLTARSVILATTPHEALELLNLPAGHRLVEHVDQVRPARAACLDVALESLPRPTSRFALGLDQPIYYSVHSGPAQLGPNGVAVVHVMRYLGPHRPGTNTETEQELEGVLDGLQPGWRQQVRSRRFLPNVTVAADVPAASRGGLAGRPSVAIPDLPRVFLAGDWVGPAGQLADASIASAEAAVNGAMKIPAAGRMLEPTS